MSFIPLVKKKPTTTSKTNKQTKNTICYRHICSSHNHTVHHNHLSLEKTKNSKVLSQSAGKKTNHRAKIYHCEYITKGPGEIYEGLESQG
jgi:hypothetical protein